MSPLGSGSERRPSARPSFVLAALDRLSRKPAAASGGGRARCAAGARRGVPREGGGSAPRAPQPQPAVGDLGGEGLRRQAATRSLGVLRHCRPAAPARITTAATSCAQGWYLGALCGVRVERGGVVLDVFGGSGSTLIACEKTNRKCRMMELDQKYCDVIIKRWEDFTGKKAELINAI